MNDIIITGDDLEGMESLKKCLIKEFEIKELGKLKYFFSIEVAHSQPGIFISQQKYILDLLTNTNMLGCKPTETPIEPNHRLGDSPEDAATNKSLYQRLVRRLISLSHTKPNIAYAMRVIIQFMHNPKEAHLK